jgi:hypothetical protein
MSRVPSRIAHCVKTPVNAGFSAHACTACRNSGALFAMLIRKIAGVIDETLTIERRAFVYCDERTMQ